jgi:hypothetical protein
MFEKHTFISSILSFFMIWILVALIIFLFVSVFVLVFVKRKGKHTVDYYTLFIMGIIWTAISVPLKNWFLGVLRIIFLIVGGINKKKWKINQRQYSKEDRKMLWIITLIGLVVLILFVGWMFFIR